DGERRAATGRMLDHYLHTAYAADRLLYPARDLITPTSPRPGVIQERPADHPQALAWFAAEHAALRAAAEHAAATGWDTHTWQLAWTLWTVLHRRGHWHDQATVQGAALAAAGRQADPAAQAHAHRNLASAYTWLGRFDDAHTHMQHALDLCRHTGDLAGQAYTHRNLAVLCERGGHYNEALDHAQQALDLYRAA